jgi:hypothetical protein
MLLPVMWGRTYIMRRQDQQHRPDRQHLPDQQHLPDRQHLMGRTYSRRRRARDVRSKDFKSSDLLVELAGRLAD